MNFHFVSVSPSKKQMIDRNMVKHFKSIQEDQIKQWEGLNTKFTQRPGQNQSEGFVTPQSPAKEGT